MEVSGSAWKQLETAGIWELQIIDFKAGIGKTNSNQLEIAGIWWKNPGPGNWGPGIMYK